MTSKLQANSFQDLVDLIEEYYVPDGVMITVSQSVKRPANIGGFNISITEFSIEMVDAVGLEIRCTDDTPQGCWKRFRKPYRTRLVKRQEN